MRREMLAVVLGVSVALGAMGLPGNAAAEWWNDGRLQEKIVDGEIDPDGPDLTAPQQPGLAEEDQGVAEGAVTVVQAAMEAFLDLVGF